MEGSSYFYMYAVGAILGLIPFYGLTIFGRPVAHPDRKLGSKHKEAEAKRVAILERLNGGESEVEVDGELRIGADDLRRPLMSADVSDVEKGLLPKSIKKGIETTLTLSCGTQFTSRAFKSMEEVHDAVASGELALSERVVLSNPARTMLQTNAELHDGIYERLQDLVKLRKSTRGKSTPTLQVDNWAILKPSDQGVDLLRIPIDKVPVILHAEYAAGTLAITGLNLDGASVFILARDVVKTVQMKVDSFSKGTSHGWWRGLQPWWRFSDTEEDLAILAMSGKETEGAFVYATTKVQLGLDGQYVDAVSKAVPIIDCFWKTVFRFLLPFTAVGIFVIANLLGAKSMLPHVFGP